MINFSGQENINQLIELEKISLMSNLDIQKNLNKQILMYMKSFMSNINFSYTTFDDEPNTHYLNELSDKLNISNTNINNLNVLLKELECIDVSRQDLEIFLNSYNNSFQEVISSMYQNTMTVQQFLCQIAVVPANSEESASLTTEAPAESNLENESIHLENPIESSDITSSTSEDSTTSTVELISPESNYIENTLIISETRKKVILPYRIEALKEKLSQNQELYTSIDDIIDKNYTLPIEYYRFTPIARFKEGFRLVKGKAKGSKIKALALGFELFTNYNLHPAIITACNSIDELDIYLACLEENNLDDFPFFNIIYEIPLANCNPKPSL